MVEALGLAQELRKVALARLVKAVDHHVSLNGQRHEFMKQVNQQRRLILEQLDKARVRSLANHAGEVGKESQFGLRAGTTKRRAKEDTANNRRKKTLAFSLV
jgi:hypothetical protein